MALSDYRQNYNNIAVINNKEIKFNSWTTKDEKNYLISVEDGSNMSDELLYNTLVKPCLEDPDIILSSDEKKILMIEIRKKSIGSTFPIKYTCSKCKNVNDIDISFDDIIHFKADSFSDIEIDNMVFIMGDIPTEKLKKRLDNAETTVERNFIDCILHIRAIEIDGKIEDTFTYDELYEFIENLSTKVFDKLFKEFNSMKGSLEFSTDTTCMICSEKKHINLDHIPGFLWG